jgi:hypothetical protein
MLMDVMRKPRGGRYLRPWRGLTTGVAVATTATIAARARAE